MASIHKRRGKFVVQWRDPGGRQHSRAFTAHSDARAFRAEIEHEVTTGRYVDRALAKATLGAFGTSWLETVGGEATTRAAVELRWRVHIEPELGRYTLAELAARPSIIQGFIRKLERQQLAPRTTRLIVRTLGACLGSAVHDHVIAANPVKGLDLPKVPKRRLVPWEPERVAAVREALPWHYRATADVGSGLGLRQGECFGLAVEDVEWLGRNPEVRVRRQVRLQGGVAVFAPPKNNKERSIPLPRSVAERLSAHIATWPSVPVTLPWCEADGKQVTAQLIFTSARGNVVHKNSYNCAWRTALDRAGVPRERVNGYHMLRHTFASVMLAAGVDLRALSEYLGHDDPGFTLEQYCHLLPSTDEKARGAIDAALSSADVRSVADVS
jgi:integrase